MTKLELTPEREQIIEDTYQEFLKVGMDTAPADFDAAQGAITELYKASGLAVPEFHRMTSIKAAENAICDKLGVKRGTYQGTSFGGQQDYFWAWFEGGRRVGVVYDEQDQKLLDHHLTIMRSINWWYPYDTDCFMCDRPEHLTVDEEGNMHNETEACIRWRDGWALYAYHGTFVPGHWVTDKENVDPAEIIRAENVEQRAAGAALIGWATMLEVLDAKVIDDSGSEDIGQLIELTLPGLDQPGRFLKARCPRNGIICEGVPYESDIDGKPINTALAAQAWRIGDPVSEYLHPDSRT